MIISDELARARKAAGMTQAALAAQAGVTRMTVQRIEAGAIDPRFSTIQEMARALGVSVMLVPLSIRSELEGFVRSGGRLLGQAPGIGAPRSIVDTLDDGPPDSKA